MPRIPTETENTEKCPICGDTYDHYRKIEDYEEPDKQFASALVELFSNVHMAVVENRLLAFYVHGSDT